MFQIHFHNKIIMKQSSMKVKIKSIVIYNNNIMIKNISNKHPHKILLKLTFKQSLYHKNVIQG